MHLNPEKLTKAKQKRLDERNLDTLSPKIGLMNLFRVE
jgi:hypothetical protein